MSRLFPDAVDEQPTMMLVQFPGQLSSPRPTYATKFGVAPGDRIYINLSAHGAPPIWRTCRIVKVESRNGLLVRVRLDEVER